MYRNQILKKKNKIPTILFPLLCVKGGLCLKGKYQSGSRTNIKFLCFVFACWKELPSKLHHINMTVPQGFNIAQNIYKQVMHNMLCMGWFCTCGL